MADPQLPADPSNERPTIPSRAIGPGVEGGEVTRLEANLPPMVSSEGPPPEFGDYELLAEVARGGMGVVYRARQKSLDRVVALKMILAGKLATPEDVQRFRTEAEAAARLVHPNIVAVHDVGSLNGQHYFSMEFIEGQSLAQRLTHGPLAGRIAARYVRQVARAVQYAHKHGIIHRDLKPSNILLDISDEPHVTDFGLAKRLGQDHGQTRTGTIMGTPSYMAPEQAAGKIRELGPACDVYSLGAVLFELITGRPPFKAESAMDTVLQVLHNDPVPPRLLNAKVDPDLETICLKCLEKNPKDRYVSAEALADDLDRYLNNESITARSFNLLDRLTRALEHSSLHVAAFHTWSTLVLIMALVVCLEHVLVFWLIQNEQPRELVLAARASQFVVLAVLFWLHRGDRLLPTSAAERELWTIWIGYLASYSLILFTTRMLTSQELLGPGPEAHPYWRDLITYPYTSIVAGLAFFIMGCNYWGWCHLLGIAFFGLAALLPWSLELGPLAFGLLWTVALVSLGLHLRQLSGQAEIEKLNR